MATPGYKKPDPNREKPKFNPTITALFENNKFGEGALLSTTLTDESINVIQKHVTTGAKLCIKRAKRLASNGSATYFLEVLPPIDKDERYQARKQSRAAAQSDDDSGI